MLSMTLLTEEILLMGTVVYPIVGRVSYIPGVGFQP